MSRLNIGLAYLNTSSIQLLIEHLSKVFSSSKRFDLILCFVEKICVSRKWHSRRAAVEFIQNLIFCNLFNIRPYAEQFRQMLMKCLYDEQYEVRVSASTTLSGCYQCHFIPIDNEDIVISSFRLISFLAFLSV